MSRTRIEHLELTLSPGATIRGRVKVAGEGSSEFSFANHPVAMRLRGIWHNPGNTEGSADDTGGVSIKDVAPGEYTVSMSNLPPDAYLKSVRLAGRELPNCKITIAGGAIVDGLEAVVSLDGGRIDGVVLGGDGGPASGAVVVVAPDTMTDEPVRRLRSSETGWDGRFSVRGLAPGRYRVLAFEDDGSEPGFFWRPGFLDQRRNEGEVVEFQEDGRKDLRLGITDAKRQKTNRAL